MKYVTCLMKKARLELNLLSLCIILKGYQGVRLCEKKSIFIYVITSVLYGIQPSLSLYVSQQHFISLR